MPLYGVSYPLLPPDGSASAPSYSFASAPTTGFYIGSGAPSISITGVTRYQFGGGTFLLTGGVQAINLLGDTVITRDGAANTLAMRNGVNAQTFRTYNTYTDASNYERGRFAWDTNVLCVGTENGGTGTQRAVAIQGNGVLIRPLTGTSSNAWQFNGSGHFIALADNTYDIGASGATRPRTIYVGTGIESSGYVSAGAASSFGWAARAQLLSPADGVIRLGNNAATDFSRLQFGGTTSSFPALKRSATVLQARLADDSGFAPLQGNLRTQANAVAETPTATHTMIITDAGGTPYRVLCVP